MGLNIKLLNLFAYWASGFTILSQSCTVHHLRKKVSKVENGEKEGQEIWTETNMQGEGTELGEKSEFIVSQGHENDTCLKSQQNKLFWTVNICFIHILFLCAFDKGKCK